MRTAHRVIVSRRLRFKSGRPHSLVAAVTRGAPEGNAPVFVHRRRIRSRVAIDASAARAFRLFCGEPGTNRSAEIGHPRARREGRDTKRESRNRRAPNTGR